MSKSALTPKQERFVEEYLIDLNATRAYRDVYGVGEKSAAAHGARLVANGKVAAAIEAAKAKLTEKAAVKQSEILEEIDRLALSDTGDLFDLNAETLRMLPMKEWPLHARRAVSSIKVRRYPQKFPEMSEEDFSRMEAIASGKAMDFDISRALLPDDQSFLKRLAEQLRAIRWDQYEVLEIKLWDKNSALEKAGRHRGMFNEALELDTTGKGVRFTLVIGDKVDRHVA